MVKYEKTYGVPLKNLHNPKEWYSEKPSLMTIRLSIPQLPAEAAGSYFAEHVYNRKLGVGTANVILTGRSVIVESTDNGDTWKVIKNPAVEGRRLFNCFTTDDGNHIVQAVPEANIRATKSNIERATLFLFDKDWQLISVNESPSGRWHGRASIDQAGDTIMFAEYHDNTAKYDTLYKNDYSKWRPLMSTGRVFRSRDGGRTWEVVFEVSPDDIRHLHTLQADPFLPKTWWLSSGDKALESRVWRSNDDGDSWIEVTDPKPNISVPPEIKNHSQAAFRYTDLIIDKDSLIWGTDDIMGSITKTDPRLAHDLRTGSRIYRTPKSNPLQLEELGYVGHPVRSIVDVGLAYLFITEANLGYHSLRPQVVALFKNKMNYPIEVATIDNFHTGPTGFSYAKTCKAAFNGRFFSHRNYNDVFRNVYTYCLQWDVEFSS
jgi:hypothetical protein